MSIVFGSAEAQAVLKRDRTAGAKKVEPINYDLLTPEQRNALPSYLVTCQVCGGMTGACTDDPADTKTTAKFIAEQISHGYSVNRVTVADVRKATWCTCLKRKNE